MPTSSDDAAPATVGSAGVAGAAPVDKGAAVSSSGAAVGSMWSSPIGARLSARPWVSSPAVVASSLARAWAVLALASPFIAISGAGPGSVETPCAVVGS